MRHPVLLVTACLIGTTATLSAGKPPIIQAAWDNDMQAMSKLVGDKVDLEVTNENGWTALMFATYQGNDAMVDLLLKAGASPLKQSTLPWNMGKFPAGTCALGITAFYGFTDIADRLLQAHADPSMKNFAGKTPIMIAKDCERWGVLDLLDPSLEKGMAKTLEEAAYTDDFKAAAWFISQNAKFDEPNRWGWTPLMRAVFEGSNRVAIKLLDAGANPNVQTITGSGSSFGARVEVGTTPLILAAIYDRRALVMPLLKAKANPNVKDNTGKTALQYAKHHEYKEIVEMLSNVK